MTDALVDAVARAIADADDAFSIVPAKHGLNVFDQMAISALAAIEAQGFVIVPKEPTPAMLVHASGFQQGEHIYAAFLSARPKKEDGQ